MVGWGGGGGGGGGGGVGWGGGWGGGGSYILPVDYMNLSKTLHSPIAIRRNTVASGFGSITVLGK